MTNDDAAVFTMMRDGRVIVLLRTGFGRANDDGFIYSTGPITSAEIGEGNPSYGWIYLRIDGMCEHQIDRMIDSRHFLVCDHDMLPG